MNATKLFAAALAALLVGGTSAQAACNMAQVANKTWVLSATDTGDKHRALFYCKFKTSAAGTVALTPNGCVAYHGLATDFSAPVGIDLISATLTQTPGAICGFDLQLSIFAPSAQMVNARLVMGKGVATGQWVSNFESYGTASLVRQ